MSSTEQIAILPLGATEQHGPHLPLETDALIAEGIAQRLVQEMGGDLNIEVLPVEKIGYSPEHLDYKGTVSLSYGQLIERWIGICENVLARGVRKLILLNAHGGNSPLLTIVATEMRVRHSMFVVATSWTRMGVPEGLFSDHECAFGIHGGDIETSVMLAMHPHLVDFKRAENFTSGQEQLSVQNDYLRAYGKHAFGWKIQDLNRKGAVGNAANATAEKGERLIHHSVKGLIKLVGEVSSYDIRQFDVADRKIEIGEINS